MKRLEVRLNQSPEGERVVGELAEREGQIFFEYTPAFLKCPLWLSPFKLPPTPGLHTHRDQRFGPIFGLFDDSLPDGWGLLLMDRFFEQQGTAPSSLSILDRLAFLGTHTMGALTYHPPTGAPAQAPAALKLGALAAAAEEVFSGKERKVLPQLLRAGGSPGGARPKVLVGVKGDDLLSGEGALPPGYEHWLVKFTAHGDPEDWGAVELAYAQMAAAAGIDMPPTRLFESDDGRRHFGVKRFDRRDGQRVHVHTFGNLIHANFRIPNADYTQLLKATHVLCKTEPAVRQAFRRMVFNIATHNRDDHVKNFAFTMSPEGLWGLSPAYDLTFAHGPGGEHTMTVAGEGRNPSRLHVLRLAQGAHIPPTLASEIMDEVLAATSRWPWIAKAAGVGPESRALVQDAINGASSPLMR